MGKTLKRKRAKHRGLGHTESCWGEGDAEGAGVSQTARLQGPDRQEQAAPARSGPNGVRTGSPQTGPSSSECGRVGRAGTGGEGPRRAHSQGSR